MGNSTSRHVLLLLSLLLTFAAAACMQGGRLGARAEPQGACIPPPSSSSSASSSRRFYPLLPPSAAAQLLLRGGLVVNADGERRADVLIEGGRVVAVGLDFEVADGVPYLDVSGKYVMPGGIDPHTHLAMPFMGTESCDDFFSGQNAALAGGTTMHIDFALPEDGDLIRGFNSYRTKAARDSVMDYGFHMAVTRWDEKVSSDMATLVAEGINSFKFFLAYKGALQVSDDQLIQGFSRCRELGALPQVHCENGDAVQWGQQRVFDSGLTGPFGHALSRPAVVEGEATGRAIRLARFVGVPLYVVHVMSKDALDEVAAARIAGQRVVGEPVASGLAFDESTMKHPNFTIAAQYVMSPPIRSQEHQRALKAALATGILQLVATDHAPFNSSQKAAGKDDFRKIPNGVNGIGERMIVVWETMVNSGLITPSDFVRITSTECAKIFNVYPQKGVVAEGSDADIIILNPKSKTKISASTHHSRMDTNIYEGWEVLGEIETTISRGKVVWHEKKLNTTRGTGRYIPMKPSGPLFHGLEDRAHSLFQDVISAS